MLIEVRQCVPRFHNHPHRMAKCGTHACRKQVFVIRMVLPFSTFNLHKGNESRAEITKMHKRARKSLNLQQKLHSVVALCHVILRTRFCICLCNICRLECCLHYYYDTLHVRQVVHIIHQTWTLSSVWSFWEKETLPQSFTRQKKVLWSIVYIWFFAEKVEKREKERLWLKKRGRGAHMN